MKKNELISLVDFVFGCDNLYPPMNELEVTNTVHEYGKIKNYATFLNTPLNISEFVPAIKVGDKWEVLEMPKDYDTWINLKRDNVYLSLNAWNDCEQYQTAKDNVIFEGFMYEDEMVYFPNDLTMFWFDDNGIMKEESYEEYPIIYKTIQDLIKYKPTLTKKGLELSGLNR